MEKINPNENVRTLDGKIGIFVKYSSRKDNSLYKSPANCFIRLNNRKSDLQCFRNYIVKHSKNIIDLIEVGDYVNEHRVYEVVRDVNSYVILENVGYYVDTSETIDEKDIKSIVTKEQFEQMEYRVKE